MIQDSPRPPAAPLDRAPRVPHAPRLPCAPLIPRVTRRSRCPAGLLAAAAVLLAACGGPPSPPPGGAGEGAPAEGSAAPAPAPGGGGTGSIAGRVTFAGTAPPPAPIQVTKDPQVCGAHPIASEELLVGADGGLQNAVVSLLDAPRGAPPSAAEVELRQKGCVFRPHVSLVPAGATLAVYNDDGILHNIHTFSALNPPFNRAQPQFNKRIDVKFDKPETIKVACDAHPWMSAWLVVTDHPYAAVSDASGGFRIEGVPAGAYTARIWHERVGERTQPVGVRAGEAATLAVELR